MDNDKRKVRVLIVDDSAVMRKLISNILDRDSGIEVVGTAIDGDFALKKVESLKPDVVTLDVDMPRMDGMTALSEIVSRHAIPVLMLSSLTARGAELTMRALELGAVDFVCKPKGAARIGELAEELVTKIKAAARTQKVILGAAHSPSSPPSPPPARGQSFTGGLTAPKGFTGDLTVPKVFMGDRSSDRIIAIGASSGGPHALRYLLPKLPADFDAAIVVVQHMPESFTSMLARWLDEICALEVREARSGDLAVPGKILIAPGNMHMKVRRTASGGEVILESGALVNGHMPSVDVLFWSVAKEYGERATGVIMTGMGSDGAAGIVEIRKSGGRTIAQDEASCAIFGMPRVAIESGHVDKVAPLSEMASFLAAASRAGSFGGEICKA